MHDFPQTIRTKRATLRMISLDDAAGWKRFNNRIHDLMPSWPYVPSIVYARNEILHYISNIDDGKEYVYVVLDDDNTVIGDFHITNIRRNKRRAEFGHALDPDWWGTGLNQEILRVISKIAARKGYVLWGKVEDENVRSWKSLERFGARYIGKRTFKMGVKRTMLRVYELPERPMSLFAIKVYTALCLVPAGEITTYKDLARAVGTGSYRGVGQALRINPFAPRVPCHRVVSSDGLIGGFMGKTTGAAIRKKITLLKKEGVRITDGRVEGFDEKRHKF